MKSLIGSISICLAVLLLACQDSRDEIKANPSTADFYRTIGEQIPLETGMAWIEFFKNNNAGAGREKTIAPWSVPETQLRDLLGSVTNLVGVAFHYGTDSWGATHVVVIPVDESLSLWSSIPGRIYVDANTGSAISQSTAQAWANSYKDAHPSDIWFHFFGADIFAEILAISYLETLDIEQGTDVLDLTPEMLLVIWNEETILGRSKADDGTMYDASNPCPPCSAE